MRTLTVLLAPDGPAAGIRDVLTDLVAAGMVDPFLWATQASVSGEDVGVVAVGGDADGTARGRGGTTTLRTALARRAHDRVRLGVVVPVGEPTVTAAAEQRLAEVVAQSGSTARVVRVRVLVARSGEQAPADVLARDGWHNVLLAPEEARGPGMPHRLVSSSVGVIDLGRLAAPVLAGVLGLWSGLQDGPLDDAPVYPGVRAARAFYRGVDAEDTERELRRRVLAVDGHLPLPQGMSASSAYIEDVPEACGAMAGRWWTKHRHLVCGPREQAAREGVRPMGIAESLRWLFRFLWAALRNAPADWYRSVLNQGSAAAARRVHGIVFGSSDSAYTVVMNGRVSGDKAAGWRDVGDASERLHQSLVAQGEHQHVAPTDLEPMWADFVDGAMTLVDAGERGGRSMPPITIGAEWGVLRSVDDAAPSPELAFVQSSAHLAASTEIPRVEPGDVLEVGVLDQRLVDQGRDPSFAREAGETRQALAGWAKAREHSYAVQVGGILAGAYRDTHHEIASLLAVLRDAGGPDREPPRRSALVGAVRVLAVLAVLAVIGAGVLVGTDLVRPLIAIGVAAAVVIVWAVLVVVAFLQEKREMFRDLARRRTLLDEAEAARANLRQALIDQQRLRAAYEQYLQWSKVVGVFLRQPFGRAPADRASGVVIGSGLPMTTRTARVVDAGAVGEVARAMRQELFSTGWLSGPWQDHRDVAGRTLAWNERPHAVGSRQDLYHGVDGSALEEWATLLARHGAPPGVGRSAWATVLGSLERRRADLDAILRRSMTVQEPGTEERLAVEAFLSGIDGEPARVDVQQFDAAHFTATARAENRPRVVDHVRSTGTGGGLSRVLSAVQFSAAAPAWEFALCASTRVGPPAYAAEDLTPPPFPGDVTGALPEHGSGMPERATRAPAAPEGFA